MDAVRSHPCVDEVIAFPRGAWRRWWRPTVATEAWRWLRSLRGRFDLVIDAQGLGRSAMMAFATGAPRRVGHSDARELGWLAMNERVQVDARHSVDRMLGLLAAIGVEPVPDLRLVAPPECDAWWSGERERRRVGRYAVLAPTTRWGSKAWPAERWRALVPALAARGFDHAVFLSSKDEREEAGRALPAEGARERCIDLSGQTTVGQGMSVIAGADLVVANDSAPLHIAVGFDRPLLALFGPTDPSMVGPYGRAACVLRSEEARTWRGSYRDSGLGDRLMRGIAVEDVLRALDEGRDRAGLGAAEVRS